MKCVAPHVASFFLALSVLSAPLWAAGPVTITEQQVTIPTYLIGPPDPNPQFYDGGNSQGAQHRIYPYPMFDNLTTERADKTYKMVYLENEYVKIGILPESGGKIFEAIDKTNNYGFFYNQHVIKPALISLLGAWISGGVEWDLPHHHRATSFLPVQYTTTESPDGSKTVWVGELELRDRTRWTVGLTLHPGKSYLEASFHMINRTPLPVSMLCFSNVAVSVNNDYQVIFPPSTQYVTYHSKNQFTSWPITDSPFQGFRQGGDASWWKNHTSSISMFAWNFTDDFVAGYDHGKNAGTMAIADHNVVPGKKFFTWGNGPGGQSEDRQLTDKDGPYIELMVGAYSDNQPDYSWMAPYETRQWTQYWYPFRDIDGVKNATTEAAVNLEVKNGKIKLGFYSTSDRPAAVVSLKLKDESLLKETIAISPGKSYVKEIDLPAGADEHDLRASISSAAGGRELVAYFPIKLTPQPVPDVVRPFPAPADIKTNEELYLAGLRNDQFRAPGGSLDSGIPPITSRFSPYWEEALKRDPGDIRVNTAMAIEFIRGGRYAEAETHLRTAITGASDRYTTPKDTEPYYYLGLALKAQGKTEEASVAFNKATWGAAWKGPAYFEIAQLDTAKGDFDAALIAVNRSLASNSESIRSLALKAAVLSCLDPNDKGRAVIKEVEKIDPLDLNAAWDFYQTVEDFPTLGLELAAEYMNAGLWDDGYIKLISVLDHESNTGVTVPRRGIDDGMAGVQSLETKADSDAHGYPVLLLYYLAYFADNSGHKREADAYRQLAAKAPTDFAFPFQMEMIPVFEAAMAANPKDSHAPYYLGNLLYDTQPDRAVALWETSVKLGADFPVVYRNLAQVLTRRNGQGDHDRAVALLEKAANLGGNGMILNDLDRLYEENGTAPDKRLALMAAHRAAINRDDVISRDVNLEIFAGNTAVAIKELQSRFFHAWEGGARYSVGNSWINANLVAGRSSLAAKKFDAALASFQAALQMPGNLIDSAGNTAGRAAEIQYDIGLAYEGLGDKEKAAAAWKLAAAGMSAQPAAGGGRGGGRGGDVGGLGAGVAVADMGYFQGLAMQKLGQADQAKPLFAALISTGTNSLTGAPAMDAITAGPATPAVRARVADAHYLLALGNIGLGNAANAKEELDLALKASPDHLAAHETLKSVAQ